MDEPPVHDVGTAHDVARLHVDAHHDHHDAVAGELAPVPQDLAADVPDAQTVHEGHPRPDAVDLADLRTDLEHVAVLADQDPLVGDPDLLGQARVVLEVTTFAVDRHEPARPNEGQQQPELLLRAVTRGVHRVGRHVEDVRAAAVQRVDHPVDRGFVPGDQARREDHRVPFLELDPLVIARGHQAEGAVRLALRAGADDHDPAGVDRVDLLDLDHVAVVHVEDPEPARGLDGVAHRAAQEADDPLVAEGRVDHLLDPVDVAGEARHHHDRGRLRHDVVQHRTDAAFAGRVARLLRVRRIRQQQVHAGAGFLGEAVQIGGPPVDRGRIQLEVTGVQQGAVRRVDRDGHPVRDRVRDVVEAHRERAYRGRPARHGQARLDEVGDLVLLELAAEQLERERRAVDRDAASEVAEQVRERPDVILVAVGQHDRDDVGRVIADELHVGQHEVDARHVRRGERQAHVEDQELAVELEGGHVPADLADPSKQDEAADGIRQGVPRPPAPYGCGRAPRPWPARAGAAARRTACRPSAARPSPGSGSR